MLGKPSTRTPRKVCGPLFHLSFSLAPSTPRKSIRSKLPVDGIRSRRIDDDVEFVVAIAGLDAIRRDPLDRRFRDVYQLDIVPVVDLHNRKSRAQPASAEAVIFGISFSATR